MSGKRVPPRPGVDVLLVSVGATTGWRAAARELQRRPRVFVTAPRREDLLPRLLPGWRA